MNGEEVDEVDEVTSGQVTSDECERRCISVRVRVCPGGCSIAPGSSL